ncbi:MAG: polyribonucleotide nucleotidyltransferase [Halanaerobiales bacterium]|nr:polyribonucleotide nucleotidyltransferase [Halanaerobiales bacterium]
MTNKWKTDFAGTEIEFETGKLAKQANGAVTVKYGDSMVLVTATMSGPREGMSYFPLMVNYEERIYSIGKIPGSVNRREGMPRDFATLSARLIDRPLRPLFPDGMRHDVQVIATILSVDKDHEPDIIAMNGASAALTLSDIPFDGPIGGVKVGLVDDELIINPNEEQRKNSKLDLTVAGTEDAVLMVEAGADEVSEDIMLEAIDKAHQEIKKIVEAQKVMRKEAGKEKQVIDLVNDVDDEIEKIVRNYASEKLKDAIDTVDKLKRQELIDQLKDETFEYLEGQLDDFEEQKNVYKKMLGTVFDTLTKEKVREMILKEKKRPDGREHDEIRPIWGEVATLPRTHGSAVFTRGETQALSVVTLGASSDEKIIFGLGEDEPKRFMHHYNFPPYSVGETNFLRSPGRREIGHGHLGERALKPMIPSKEEFPYTIRIVSEVLESNGSSSQASICGSSMALMDAGVKIKNPVSGIAMGLIKEGEDYAILSDIQGMEDHYGDMDFKVAGTPNGITALQMDIKVTGLQQELLKKALNKAKEGRLSILDKMLEVIDEPRENLSEFAPLIMTMNINPDKIRFVIGPGGKMINKIIDETDASIDIEDDGTIFIMADSQENGLRAKEMIEDLTREVEVGEVYNGKVIKIMNFGAFVEILPGKEGLVHISKIADRHIDEVTDVLSEGDEIKVKVIKIDDKDRINLSMKDVEDDE